MDSKREDKIGIIAGTAGMGADELASRSQESGDDYRAIMSSLLADRFAEAAAAWLHKKVRGEWGFPDPEGLSLTELLEDRFRGLRPAYGYPSCPDHRAMRKTLELLDAEEIGMRISENNAIIPAAGISGLFFAHPESRYFSVGRISKAQVADYSQRQGIGLLEAEGLLHGNVGYFSSN